jgi:hypothetical protein
MVYSSNDEEGEDLALDQNRCVDEGMELDVRL